MRILTFATSLRKDSFNKKLIAYASQILKASKGIETDVLNFSEFELPIYNGDSEEQDGVPALAEAFSKRIELAQGVIISTPEYNGGISGVFKNAIDWVSRTEPVPLVQKPILLLGASPGALGAVRGLWHTRVPLEALGAYVYPEMFGLPQAHKAFDEQGKFTDEKNTKRLESLIQKFTTFCQSQNEGAQK